MAREDAVRCLRCLLYSLNLLFWVRGAAALIPAEPIGAAVRARSVNYNTQRCFLRYQALRSQETETFLLVTL